MLKITKLDSGLQIVTYKIDRLASAISISFNVGRRNESPDEAGISHFLEHILLKGSQKYPTPIKVRESIESLGGDLNAATDTEETKFHGEILVEHLDQALDTLSDAIQNPLLDEARIEKEKSVLQEEINKLRDNPSKYVARLGTEVLWAGQPMSGSKDVEEKTLPTITRGKLQNYLDKHYTASNCVITIAGNIDHEDWVKKISSSIKLPTSSPEKPTPAKNISGVQIKELVRSDKQTNLELAFYAPSYHDEDRHSFKIMSSILGHRLLDNLRYDKALAYNVGTGGGGFSDTGDLRLHGGFKAGNVELVLENMFYEITRLKKEPPKEAELDRAKARIKSSVAFRSESVFGLRNSYSFRVLKGIEPLAIEEEIPIFEKVSAEDITEVAKKYLSIDTFKIAAIGPEEDLKFLESHYGKSTQKVSN